jgi:hypothetical protein
MTVMVLVNQQGGGGTITITRTLSAARVEQGGIGLGPQCRLFLARRPAVLHREGTVDDLLNDADSRPEALYRLV